MEQLSATSSGFLRKFFRASLILLASPRIAIARVLPWPLSAVFVHKDCCDRMLATVNSPISSSSRERTRRLERLDLVAAVIQHFAEDLVSVLA